MSVSRLAEKLKPVQPDLKPTSKITAEIIQSDVGERSMLDCRL